MHSSRTHDGRLAPRAGGQPTSLTTVLSTPALLRGDEPTARAQCQAPLRSSGLTPGPTRCGIRAEPQVLRA
jgi:hypothetical protein